MEFLTTRGTVEQCLNRQVAIFVFDSPPICTHERIGDMIHIAGYDFMLLFSSMESTRSIVNEHGRNKRANALMQ